jgi:hypothetical protein
MTDARIASVVFGAFVLFLSSPAGAEAPDAGAPADEAGAPAEQESVAGCVERLPQGTLKPEIVDTFPERGRSGYAATLSVTVEHGKGESVLPRGLELQTAGDASRVLKDAGFVIPHQDGGAGARLLKQDSKNPDRAVTVLELPLVPLPKEPGRHTLTLPPLPVVVARASGEWATLCTKPHAIITEDPIAETPDPRPKENPPARPQREEWTALTNGLLLAGGGLVAGLLLGYLGYRWWKRPKPVPPPPPPRPPWEIALEKLDEVRHAGLLETGRFSDYFDRVNDAVRSYLGARYDFDGLESTTDEIMAHMARVPHFGLALPEIKLFLQECDLVKFANLIPTLDDCQKSLSAGERIVRVTMPSSTPKAKPAGDATEISA